MPTLQERLSGYGDEALTEIHEMAVKRRDIFGENPLSYEDHMFDAADKFDDLERLKKLPESQLSMTDRQIIRPIDLDVILNLSAGVPLDEKAYQEWRNAQPLVSFVQTLYPGPKRFVIQTGRCNLVVDACLRHGSTDSWVIIGYRAIPVPWQV